MTQKANGLEWKAAQGTDVKSSCYDAMMSGFRVTHNPDSGKPGEPG